MVNSTTNTPLDAYFNTEDEHYNEYAFDVYESFLVKGLFKDISLAMRLWDEQVKQLVDNCATPAQAFQNFETALKGEKVSDKQKHLLFDQVQFYLENTEFEQDVTQVISLLNIQSKKYASDPFKVEDDGHTPKGIDLRSQLKTLFQAELERIPELLEGLEDKERLQMILKMMPFVMPKVDKVNISHGEAMWN